MNRVTLSITLEPAVHAKLPAKNKSGVINEILKTHYQRGAADNLSHRVKQDILQDPKYLAQLHDKLETVLERCPQHPAQYAHDCPYSHYGGRTDRNQS